MSRPAALVALFTGALCGLLAAPGVTWLDAGELGAAAAELGVAHPPGFPLYAMVHKAVMLLVPLGDLGFRGNLASGLMAALAAAAIYGAGRGFGAGRAAAMAGAGLFVASPWLMLHGTTIEVYTGAAAMTAGGLWAVAALARQRGRGQVDTRPALALAFGVGLAAGHHAELRLFVLLLLVPALARVRRRRRAALLALTLAVLGGLVVLYLPLRAATDPWRNWGDPSTIGALWDHLSGARIRAAFADRFGRLEAGSLALYARQLLGGAPLAVGLGFIGFVAAAARPAVWLLPLVWLVDALYATALNPMGLVDGQNGLVGLVALAIGAGLGLQWLFDRPTDGLRPAVARLAAAAAVLAAGLWAAPRLEIYRADRGLLATTDRIGDRLPPEALTLVASDNLAAGLAWAQVVEGARPDLAVIVRQHVGYASSVEPVARRLPAALAGWSPGVGLDALERLGGDWPVGWESASDLDRSARPPDLGPAWPLLVRPAPSALEAVEVPIATDTLGPQGRRAAANWASDRGRFELQQRRVPLAGAAFEQALDLEPENGARWNNLATALAAAGRHADAMQAATRAVELNPGDRTARANLARYALHAGQPQIARTLLDALIAEQPTADVLALRGVVRGNAGDLAGAGADFAAALRLDPGQPEARAGMEKLESLRRGPR